MTAKRTAQAARVAGAASHPILEWHAIDWRRVHQNVRRLQARIVKAIQDGRWGKVHALQHLLTHSFSAKALAVRRVTENQGKRTPGVDRVTWRTPEQKATAIGMLRQRGYRPQPLRRVYVAKSNGKRRGLGIPTMRDRAMQALYLLAVDSLAETLADPNSYGFRTHRSPADAIEQCYIALAKKASPQWVLEAVRKQTLYKRRPYRLYRVRLSTALLDDRPPGMLLEISKALICWPLVLGQPLRGRHTRVF